MFVVVVVVFVVVVVVVVVVVDVDVVVVFLVPGMGFSIPSILFFRDLVFQFLPRVFSVPFGFFGSRRGCFRFPSKHGVSGCHLWVFSVPVFFLSFLFVMIASASVPFPSWVFSVPGGIYR